MFGSVCDRIGSRSSLKTSLALLALVCLFVPILAIVKASIPDAALPGGQFSYSAEQAYRALGEVGSDGRRWFTTFQLVDFFFIPAYALLFATTINLTYRTLLGRASIWTGLCLVPLLAGLVDYVENACLLVLVAAYPQPMASLATVAGLATSAKWVLVGGSFLLTIVGLAGVVLKQALAPRPMGND